MRILEKFEEASLDAVTWKSPLNKLLIRIRYLTKNVTLKMKLGVKYNLLK